MNHTPIRGVNPGNQETDGCSGLDDIDGPDPTMKLDCVQWKIQHQTDNCSVKECTPSNYNLMASFCVRTLRWILAAPNYVYTMARVAGMLGKDEALLGDIAMMNIDPEDGRLYVIHLNHEVSTTAFTPFGIENLKELLADLGPNKTSE